MEYGITLDMPLMYKTKADTVRMAQQFDALDLLAYTHTCYNGVFPPCNECPACVLRARGFSEAGIEDPLMRRARTTNGHGGSCCEHHGHYGSV
jgi:7-cyano-7-deazaguanine synthase